MRTTSLATVLLALVASCSTPGSPTQANSEVREVLEAQSTAWNRGDVDGFMAAGYWHSPELTFYSQGSVTKGYEATLERYRRRYLADGAEMGRLKFSAVETEALADGVQLARGHWKLEFRKNPTIEGLFSLILKRLPDGWRIVHDHTSVDAAND